MGKRTEAYDLVLRLKELAKDVEDTDDYQWFADDVLTELDRFVA